jgi:hypothetical protein
LETEDRLPNRLGTPVAGSFPGQGPFFEDIVSGWLVDKVALIFLWCINIPQNVIRIHWVPMDTLLVLTNQSPTSFHLGMTQQLFAIRG